MLKGVLIGLSLCSGLMLGGTGAIAQADVFPSKPVKIVVPFGAGGITDIIARTVAAEMSQTLGQQVIVENKPGAGNILATETVRQSPADGYTILFGGPGGMAINFMTRKTLPYKVEDFEPVAMIFDTPYTLTVNSAVPANSVKELVEYAKSNPGKLRYATNGPGSSAHLVGELFENEAKVNLEDVPYRGNASSTLDLVAGTVSVAFDAPTTLLPHVKAGKLRVLAVTSAERSPVLPDVPTFKEAGYPNIVVGYWGAFFVPKGTPKTTIDKLTQATIAAVNSQPVKARFSANGTVPVPKGGEAVTAQIRHEFRLWEDLTKKLGIQLD